MRKQDHVKKSFLVIIVLLAVVALTVSLLCSRKKEHSFQTTDTVLMVSPVAFGFNEEK